MNPETAEGKYRDIFENAVEGIFQTTPEGRYLSANPAMARIFGYDSAAEMIAQVADIAHQLYVDPERRTAFVRQVEERGLVSNFEVQIRRRDGSERWISKNARAVRDAGGNLLYCEGSAVDITENQQAEEELRESKDQLEEANRQLKENQTQLLQTEKLASIGQLAAGVAHEINNPVGFILSNLTTLGEYVQDLADLLKSYNALEEQIDHGEMDKLWNIRYEIAQKKEEMNLDFILEDLENLTAESHDGAERVRKIVQNLKEFSHVDQEEKMPANLNAGLESTLNIVWNELKYKCTVEKDYGDIPELMCYPMELNQVFMNLLVNAAQAIEERGTITIRTYQEDGAICVAIADTGTGMPPEVQKRIFEPFFTTKEVGKGTGLGLSMAYNIVKKHDGAMLVDSEEGAGTCFTVKIPLE